MFAVLKTFAWMLLFYVLLLLCVFIIESIRPEHGNIDILRDYPRSIYADEASLAAYGVDIAPVRKQIFILGASAPGYAFLSDRLMTRLDGYQVNNLCLRAANVTEMDQVVDLIEERADLTKLNKPIFVIGGHFLSFLDNEREFGAPITTIQQEFIRHGLYRTDGNFVIPRWGGKRTTAVLTFLMRPFMLIYKVKVWSQESVKFWTKAAFVRSPTPNPRLYRRYRELAFQSKGFTDDQFDELTRLIHKLKSKGAAVIFVQLPVPSYYRHGFPIYDEYRQRTNSLAHDCNVSVLDMSDWAPDNEFIDDTHAVKSARYLWSDWLGHFLEDAVVAIPKVGQWHARDATVASSKAFPQFDRWDLESTRVRVASDLRYSSGADALDQSAMKQH